MQKSVFRLLSIGGFVGPIIYVIVLSILGFFEPGYNHVTQYMSELAAVDAPNMVWMNVFGFMLLGVLLVGFGFALDYSIKKNRWGWIGPFLVIVSGVGLVLTGFFPCDLGCVNTSLVGWFHGLWSFIAQFALIGAPFFMFFRLRYDTRWVGFQWISMGFFSVGIVLGLLYKSYVFDASVGLLQRVSFGVPFLWVFVMAWKMSFHSEKKNH